jgi:hypothetical protein
MFRKECKSSSSRVDSIDFDDGLILIATRSDVNITPEVIDAVRKVHKAKVEADDASRSLYNCDVRYMDISRQPAIDEARELAQKNYTALTEELGVAITYSATVSCTA